MARVAVIDLGTNTFHLLIADIIDNQLHLLHKEKQSVKIGEGGISRGEIAAPAQQRALNTLQGFKEVIDDLEVEKIYANATSAFRNAGNGRELAAEIYRQTGIPIQIIDGQKEAWYIYRGVSQALDMGPKDSLILDIGGGSVEFIIANESSIQWMHSFEIGAQRLMDRFHHHDPITTDDISDLENYLDQQLTQLFPAMKEYHPQTLIGASGTFDTLSQIYSHHQGIPMEGTERTLTNAGFHEIHQQIIHKNRSQRMAIPGMIEMRVDMIVVACSLINYLLKKFSFQNIRISTYALKEGVLSEVVESM